MSNSVPLPGMTVFLRSKWGQITSVEPFNTNSAEGTLNLVSVEYQGGEGGGTDTVVWEREADAKPYEPGKLRDLTGLDPLAPAAYHSLVRAAKWSALSPFLDRADPTKRGGQTVTSPFFGSLQAEDFQLSPLLRALKMPRISLLIADDVGVGKTIEAGLIIQELLLRRKIRRVLILTPAFLKPQWQGEMKDRFSLNFNIVDREETTKLRKDQGLTANPWRLLPRIISSYHYLRQPDVLEQFLSTCRPKEGEITSRLPWDLLLVDEAHNLMPSSYGSDSDLVKMLRQITPFFEHKLFLTATPHNGHTRSFTGLLELLDPVRFTQKSEMEQADKERASQVVVRRLKREINKLDKASQRPERFVERKIIPQHLYLHKEEIALSMAFNDVYLALRRLIAAQVKGRKQVGTFAFEILQKRLLSCPFTFADSWFRLVEGVVSDDGLQVTENDVQRQGELALRDDTEDDGEKNSRARTATKTLGVWLQPYKEALEPVIAPVTNALKALGLDENGSHPKKGDSRSERLIQLIEDELLNGGAWRDDERLIVFTEYKTTLDYLAAVLMKKWPDADQRVQILFGGLDQEHREVIKAKFNDPEDPVRILLATDAASEGLNLQQTARRVIHFDVPWNPSRLEQRNGRLDRHGQARDVMVYHFTSDDDLDLQFLGKVVDKVNHVREDLGTMGELFDRAFQRRLLDRDNSSNWEMVLDKSLDERKAKIQEINALTTIGGDSHLLEEMQTALSLSPKTLLQTLEQGLNLDGNTWKLKEAEKDLRWDLGHPIPPKWAGIVDEELRVGSSKNLRGTLPSIAFDAQVYMTSAGGKPVFRPRKDTVLLHLGHTFYKEFLFLWNQRRYSPKYTGRLWTVLQEPLPLETKALFRLTVEELGVNQLRETFHHWVRTWEIPLTTSGWGGLSVKLGEFEGREDISLVHRAKELLEEHSDHIRGLFQSLSEGLTNQTKTLLTQEKAKALSEERQKFDERIAEVAKARKETTLEKLKKERDALEAEIRQGYLFDEALDDDLVKLRNLDEELAARQSRYKELEEYLRQERERMLNQILPQRHELLGAMKVFPIGVEIILPEVENGK